MSLAELQAEVEQLTVYAGVIAARIEQRAERWTDFLDADGELVLDEEAMFCSCFDGSERVYDRIRNDFRVVNALAYAMERMQELAEDHKDYMKHMVFGSVYSQLRYHGMNVSDFH